VLSARALYDQQSGKTTPEYFALLSDTFADDRLGVLLSGSYQRRRDVDQYTTTAQWNPLTVDASNQSIFADQHGNGPGTYWFPAKLTNDYIPEDRTRKGLDAAIQVKFTDELVFSADALYSSFDVISDGIEKAWYGNLSQIVPGSAVTDANNAVTKYSFINGPEFVKLNFDRANTTRAVGGNLKWTPTDRYTTSLDLSTSDSANNDGGKDQYFVIHGPDTILTYDNTRGYATPIGIDGAIQGYNSTVFPPGSPQLAAAPPVGSTWSRNSLTGYRTWWTTRDGAEDKDRVYEARWDNLVHLDTGWFDKLRGGIAYSDQTKDLITINSDDVGWGNYGAMGIPVPANLLQVSNIPNFLNGANTPSLNQFLNFNGNAYINYLLSSQALALRDQLNGLPPGTSAAAILPRGYSAIYQPGLSYSVAEKVWATYAELTLKGRVGSFPLTVVGGARYEWADEQAHSMQQKLLDILNAPGSGGTQYASVVDSALSPVTQKSKYHELLPSLNAKLALTDRLLARAAISKSLTRPDPGKLNPVIDYPATLRPAELVATGGNGNLSPYTAWNYDFSLEWYYSQASYLAASYYYKKIDGLIVSSIVRTPIPIANSQHISDQNISGNTAYFDVAQYVNLGSTNVSGVEVAWQHAFTSLPWLFKYTGVTASLTFPRTDATFNKASFVNNGAFPGLSNSYFLTGFYDDGKWQARVSWSHRDAYYNGLVTATEPEYILGSSQWDARISYDFTRSFQIFADCINISNTPVREVGRYSSEFLNYEETGARFDIGVRYKY
jgi:TonB-dependent receptor